WPPVNGIALIGSGEASCFIDGDSLASVIRFEENLWGIIEASTLITGFTILNGYAQGDWPEGYGGGIYCHSSSPSVVGVTISGNSANISGGGVQCYASSPNLVNVTISGNSAAGVGGGIYCSALSSPSLVNITLDNNTASHGGGLYCSESNPRLENVMITSNSSEEGGGICCWETNWLETDVSLSGVLISGNSAVFRGGGISCSYSNPTLDQVTIVDNTAAEGGGIYCRYDSNPALDNSLLWSNTPQQIELAPYSNPSSVTINCCDIEGGEAGIETNNNGEVYWQYYNIVADPYFCDSDNGDYRLQLDSPCRTNFCGIMGYSGETCDGEGLEMLTVEPPAFFLSQNHPNPFNPATTIEFSLETPAMMVLSVFNIKGQLVDVIQSGFTPAGSHRVVWRAVDLPSGVYYCRMQLIDDSGEESPPPLIRKMIYLK
ncbi:MAG: hypothetical protein ISR91_06240, partial [Candidatus Delongbacteria bacterium]|nr:hypothetical protein [Candidatus Delongbacteria bacterium]